ncbi:Pls/PosA family non-ribosomal peptide synthetase [Kineococcus arenarius]|uniref:Pls/PosA family non-ribosomal peptide synthetase n=1 Tax=unclassified Kineococcus TaxID=2621656 RepID=UPI003D7E77E1
MTTTPHHDSPADSSVRELPRQERAPEIIRTGRHRADAPAVEPVPRKLVPAHRRELPLPPSRSHPPATPRSGARMHHVFEASCDATPAATAVQCEDEPMSYAELDVRANWLAHHLRRSGIDVGDRVAVYLHRSLLTYSAVLGVLKSGATLVPIDPTSPQDRVEYIATDSDVDLIITTRELADTAATTGRPVLVLDEAGGQLSTMPSSRPVVQASGDPVAYIIYTSGSSGRPKGVQVAQSSICNFLQVVPELYGVRREDRVYQGMTIAFDFSIEEIWPTWAVGATVVAGPNDGRRLGSELADFLEHHRVTMLYCVPTVLATIDRDLPLLHTLNVGGEACSQELVERWSQGGRRRILNTYGPTEATVTATMAELVAGKPVTIGRALPTYTTHVLDEQLRPLPDGEPGELCIGGPGVAVGYVGRPDLTAEKFLPDPFSEGGRLYRTGDLARVLPDGEIEYLGRADSEVKVRGHRVDLQEIENVLREDDGVNDAVVTLHKEIGELAGYVTAHPGQDEDELLRRVRERLQRQVPPYMVPPYLLLVDAFPMLPSGKADRKALPVPTGGRSVGGDEEHVAPATPLEQEVAAVWADVLGLEPTALSVEADFFIALGGHSLAAANVVSTLRRRQIAPRMAVGDLYAHPTVRELAAHLQADADRGTGAAVPERAGRARHGSLRVALCGAGQFASLYALMLLFCAPVALAYSFNDGRPSLTLLVQLMLATAATFLLGRWVFPPLGSRLLTIGVRPGRYRLWGWTHLRVWFLQKLMVMSPITVLSGSPLLPGYLRLCGARVGRDVHIASGEVMLPTLTTIGDGASVGYGAQLQCFHVEDGWLHVGRVEVGPGAFVGSSALVGAGASLGAEAVLSEHSSLPAGAEVPAGQRWTGSPAVPDPQPHAVLAQIAAAARFPAATRRLRASFRAGFLGVELVQLITLLPPIVVVWWTLLTWGSGAALAACLLTGPLYVGWTCLLVALLRRRVLPETPVGVTAANSSLGLRKWLADKLLELSLISTNTLYSTLLTSPWLRALGARVGRGAEVSTVAHLDPDLLDLAPGSFVADMASVGSATYYRGAMVMERTTVGSRAFIGNASFVPAGTSLGDDSLVGVHTVPPAAGAPEGSSWLGSPAIFLPRRQESGSFDESQTFRPHPARVLQRHAIEFARITLPASVLAISTFLAMWVVATVASEYDHWIVVVAAPAAFLGAGLVVVCAVAGFKWLAVGRYRPRVEPLWNPFVRWSELATGLYEAAAVPALLQPLAGTPMLGPLLRLFGTHVGRRTYIDTTYLTEFDLVHIGDDACIGSGVSLQTHLFEDRVMKMSDVRIEAGASVGTRSVVLYDAVVGAGSTLGPLSLVMKGETLAAGTHWRGIPAQAER